MKMDIEFICKSVNGQIIYGSPKGFVTDVNTDSRNITGQSLFIALKGDKFDGHEFVLEALQKGAYAALVDKSFNIDKGVPASEKVIIKVEDTLKALHMLAKSYREQFNLPIVAVTGSVGKTTTKDIIAVLLKSKFETLKTEGNFNNDIGVPLTIFKIREYHKAAVIELAMRAKGEIDRLSYIVRPYCAVITNVEPVHLETLGSLENIAQAKCEVLKYIDSDGFALINGDNQILCRTASNYSCRKYTFGYNKDCDFRIISAENKDKGINIKVKILGDTYDMFFPVPTSKMAYNAVAGVAIAYLLGVNINDAIADLASYEPGANRLNIFTLGSGGKVINDVYNANPLSMEAALETGKNLRTNGRFVAVLGDMYELGSYEISGHLKVGRKAAENGVDILVTLGKLAAYIARGALEAGMTPQNVYHFDSKEEALEFLCSRLNANDTVLFKASRGMRMETLVDGYLRFMGN